MSRSITLASETDVDGFRHACRRLLADHIAPERTSWFVAGRTEADLFAPQEAPLAAAPAISIPSAYLTLIKRVLLHRDPNRFGLIYRLLWRLQHEPGLRHDPLDADVVAARHLAQAVRRDLHKMKAFVRFREVRAGAGEPPQHVAWFEPEHHIVETVAPFFARRFTAMRWAILTPERCVRWDGRALAFSPGTGRHEAPAADAGEQLWLTYYAHVFNPARLKLAMMQKEMPRRYWKNLPEAVLISPLSARAAERSAGMIAQAPTDVARRVPPALLPRSRQKPTNLDEAARFVTPASGENPG